MGPEFDSLLAYHFFARMVELVDTLDLGSSDESRGGSIPSVGTIYLYFTKT